MDTGQFENRKRDHLRHALDSAHQAAGLNGLDRIHLLHEALPDLNLDEIDLGSPFFISAMTAGHGDAEALNAQLASACEERGGTRGIGSQRRDIEAGAPRVEDWAAFRARFPKLTLLANVGISQLPRLDLPRLLDVLHGMRANALAVHLNALQEAMQPEGTPSFRGALDALAGLAQSLKAAGIPLVVKETGCGFTGATIGRLIARMPTLAAIDVSGLGGTHWGRIEGARAESTSLRSLASATFSNWGESTVDSVLAARGAIPADAKTEIWASGGVRSGLDAAKLIALGAHRVGYAQPALAALQRGAESLRGWMELQEFELRVALFCTGCKTPYELRTKENKWKQSDI